MSYHNHISSITLFSAIINNDLIKLLKTFLVSLLSWYKRYSICLISFFNLFELFQAFVCANNIGSLVNGLFGVKTFNPVPAFFRGINFTLSAIVSCGSNFTSS